MRINSRFCHVNRADTPDLSADSSRGFDLLSWNPKSKQCLGTVSNGVTKLPNFLANPSTREDPFEGINFAP